MKLIPDLRLALLFAALALPGVGNAAGLLVSPSSISNTYSGPLSLQITGVPNGATVRVELLRDFNANTTADAGDTLIKRFTVIDGTQSIIAGRTNSNVPGDLDAAANGTITISLDYRHTAALDHVAGAYLFRLTSPTSAFTPVLVPFNVTATAYPQQVSGTVAGASNCVVALVNPARPTTIIVGTTTSALGAYTLPCPVGDFKVLCLQAGSVTDLANAPVVTVGATQTVNQDLAFLNPDRNLTGTLRDGPGGSPLPGVQIIAQSSGGNLSFGFTDAAGAFSIAAVSDTWNLQFSAADLAKLGCLGISQPNPIDATATPVAAASFESTRATSLIYGRITADAGQPVPDAYLSALDISNYLFTSFATSDDNGNYTLGVTDGYWFVEPVADRLSALNFLGRSAVVSATAAGTTLQDFLVRSVTSTIQGVLVDDNGAPVADLALTAIDQTFNIQRQTRSGPDGSFSLGLFGSSWSISFDEFEAQQLFLIPPRLTVITQDGVNQTDVNLIFLRATATISGIVTNAAGNPLPSIYITANLNSGTTNYQTSGFTVDDGTYSLRVAPGNWQFTLSDLTDQGYLNPAPQDRTIADDAAVNWSVVSAPPVPPTLAIEPLAAGRFRLTLTGQPNRTYTIESASSLASPTWSTVITNPADPDGRLVQEDTPAANGLPRFYRAVLQP